MWPGLWTFIDRASASPPPPAPAPCDFQEVGIWLASQNSSLPGPRAMGRTASQGRARLVVSGGFQLIPEPKVGEGVVEGCCPTMTQHSADLERLGLGSQTAASWRGSHKTEQAVVSLPGEGERALISLWDKHQRRLDQERRGLDHPARPQWRFCQKGGVVSTSVPSPFPVTSRWMLGPSVFLFLGLLLCSYS